MFPRRTSLVLSALALCCGTNSIAQQNDIPLQRDIYIDVERNAAKLDTAIHTGLKPLIESRADLTNVMGHREDKSRHYYWLTEKIFKEHLVIVDEGEFHLTVDPLFNFEYGYDLGDQTRYADTNRYVFNTRGFWIAGNITKKVSFQTMFHENQAVVPQYLYRAVLESYVMPGQGRVKVRSGNKFDFGWSQANVSYSPATWLNLQMGHGKHFVGHGYRSMLLSDNAMNAPYLQFSLLSPDHRWQYTSWHTKLMHGVSEFTGDDGINDRLPTGASSEALFYWMRGRFNHLSCDLGRLQLGLFESTIFRTIDENGVRPFDAQELNPVIGLNTLVYGFDGGNKSLVGVDLRVKATSKAYAYGQFATDGPSRYAFQVGARAFDVLRKDLHLQVEYNSATPYMYTHSPVRQAYMHGGLPLAHPLGTSFSEVVGIVDAGFGRYWFQCKVNVAVFQRDTSLMYNHGTDLNRPDDDLPSPEGAVERTLTFLDINASYLFNQNTNLRFVLGCSRRDVPGDGDGMQSTYIYASVRTSLFNRYYDL